MRILGLDLGTKCGFALIEVSEVLKKTWVIGSGTWNLQTSRFSGGGMRFIQLRNHLEDVGLVDRIYFEEIRRHLGVDAAHLYGGFMATVQAYCEEHAIPYQGIPVGTIKKLATGKGNSGKEQMIGAAQIKWPDILIVDDNQADALWCAEVGRLTER